MKCVNCEAEVVPDRDHPNRWIDVATNQSYCKGIRHQPVEASTAEPPPFRVVARARTFNELFVLLENEKGQYVFNQLLDDADAYAVFSEVPFDSKIASAVSDFVFSQLEAAATPSLSEAEAEKPGWIGRRRSIREFNRGLSRAIEIVNEQKANCQRLYDEYKTSDDANESAYAEHELSQSLHLFTELAKLLEKAKEDLNYNKREAAALQSASPQQPSGWRPIAEAPRGTSVLLGAEGCEIVGTGYAEFADTLCTEGHEPTCWQPLPEPPSGKEK